MRAPLLLMSILGVATAALASTASGPHPLAALGEVPAPPDNPVTEAKTRLGELLFFDPRLSGDTTTSCATCHEPSLGWGDGNPLSRGYPGTAHWRNSQTVLNSAYYRKLFWAGESTSLEGQADAAITGNLAGNGEPETIEERLAEMPEYVALFKEAFGIERPNYPAVLKAIATYERSVPVQKDTPFDRYMRGDASALNASQEAGMALFTGKAACIQCHDGALLSDEDYHALGVPDSPLFATDAQRQIALRFQHYTRGEPEPDYRAADGDLGLFFVTGRDADRGRFRTPSLRELVHTAPYMHSGVFATLGEVVDFYDKGGGDVASKDVRLRPLGLSAAEKADIVAFLEALSGEAILVERPKLPTYPTRK